MLTEKQEQFCHEYIETGSASEAYRSSYNASRMKDTTIYKRASELLAHGEITGRLAELRQPAIEKAKMTLENHLEELATLRDKAKEEGQLSAAIQAEIARGKAAGFYSSEGVKAALQVNVMKQEYGEGLGHFYPQPQLTLEEYEEVTKKLLKEI